VDRRNPETSSDPSSSPPGNPHGAPEASAGKPGSETALLARLGGDPESAARTGAAVEGFFSGIQDRFRALLGEDGYRALLQEAHRRAVRAHPVLEKCPVETRGNPFFGGLGTALSGEDPREVWESLSVLAAEFLHLANRVGRREETMLQGDFEKFFEFRDKVPEEAGHGGATADPQGEGKEERDADPWRLLIMDRDRITCEAMVQALDGARDFEVAGYGHDPEEIQALMADEEVDFVVASAHLPTEDVLEVCRWLRREHTGEFPHVVVTGLPPDDAVILRFLEAGGAAFTMEDFSVEGLRLALRLLARGESVFPLRLQHLMSLRLSELAELVRDRGLNPDTLSELTAREGEVLLLLEKGLTNREVARRLFISEGTVKSHVHQILRKLNVRNRKEAVRVLRLQRAAPGKLVLGKTGFRKET